MANDGKRKSHKGAMGAATGAAAILLGVMLFSGRGLGFGTGDGTGTIGAPTGNTPTETTQSSGKKQGNSDTALYITVTEQGIEYGGMGATLDELKESLIKDYTEGKTKVELREDHAIKADYDEVIALLESLSIKYEEKE